MTERHELKHIAQHSHGSCRQFDRLFSLRAINEMLERFVTLQWAESSFVSW